LATLRRGLQLDGADPACLTRARMVINAQSNVAKRVFRDV
jgi:hypothetical protein